MFFSVFKTHQLNVNFIIGWMSLRSCSTAPNTIE
jgi:hypothetical protein